ncbi:uncharacterized protein N7446_001893 [Penicillium canescens]|uniref:Uncharacterized protein n=1 Tax=Penicillium canescens TaxID=5083 RepID=A0AAD6IDY8_PENCN|nr:uncharacterized protein N7446_001893 [Penicillium canescens]KAJ6043697.1 hypothetical protein N7460_005052 [Penicillium canescens]KAJ6055168.1 hypothetical protein N7444_004266 [Penicillium canescens]KAJ6074116.1 hypothetical protein N7446_001893 [Penicillium canescens]
MMVPRAFLFSSAPPQKPFQSGMKPFPSSDYPDLHGPATKTETRRSNSTTPVVIPPKRGSRMMSGRQDSRSRTLSKTSEASRRSSSSSSSERHIPTSFTSMLDATAIPVPRRNWSTRRPRKLPRGNHVEDFNRMLRENVRAKDHFLDGTSNSPLDILLSPPDEDHDKLIGNESEQESQLSLRSISSDSMPSLEHGLVSPSSLPQPPTPGSQKSPLERRQLRYFHSEECASDHPLLETELDECEVIEIQEDDEPVAPGSAPTKRSASFGSFPRFGSTFKSNLTASLRAIKFAAHSVSTFATPSVQPEDFLTRSLFTIAPELTDDRRPLPMQETPSPALRRYLNPTPMSPAEMHVYHDHPHETLEAASACSVSIQMQTYRRTGGRSHRRNNFHIASRDKRFTFDPEVPQMSRQREPRENSNFLRVVVLEMNMRRCGKLRDDIPTRARIWLPARKTNNRLSGQYEDCDDNDTVPSRWVGVSA